MRGYGDQSSPTGGSRFEIYRDTIERWSLAGLAAALHGRPNLKNAEKYRNGGSDAE
jgi:hypothetical protein